LAARRRAAPSASSPRAARVPRRVALGELVAQVGEARRGAGAERDRLLDLEVARDLRAVTPRPYSTGTSARKRSSCWRAARGLVGVNGAAVKPSSAAAARVRAAENRAPPAAAVARRPTNARRASASRAAPWSWR
jgi:hypothetical protein